MSIDPERSVLLPIDMQMGFDDEASPPRWNKSLDANGLALLAAWRAAKRPIIHIRHDSVQSGSTLAPGHPGNRHRPGFEPQADEPLITKSVNSAFIGTDLDLRLRRLDAKHVVVFGLVTDMCVSTTIRMGANLGWDMILVPDACDCFALPDQNGSLIPADQIHAAHVATLAHEFCRVMNLPELTAWREAA